MGLLGGLQGLGQGMAKVGEEGMQATLQQQRDDALSGREDARIKAADDRQDAHDAAAAKAAAAHDAAEEERQKSIYKWKNQADLDKISDPRYVADKDAEAKRNLDKDTTLENLKHQHRLEEERAKAEAEKGKKDKDMFGKVQLKNGQVVSESDLRGDYTTRWGKFDPMGNLIGMEPGAPTYDDYRNTQVTPDYQRSFNPASTDAAIKDKQAKDQRAKAQVQATQEADSKAGYLSTDAQDFGAEGRQGYIDRRTNEILNGGSGLLNTPQAPSAASPSPATPAVTLTTPATPSGPAQIKDVAGYNALPQGAHYIDPNGVERVKQ